jgi:hypothetical protein
LHLGFFHDSGERVVALGEKQIEFRRGRMFDLESFQSYTVLVLFMVTKYATENVLSSRKSNKKERPDRSGLSSGFLCGVIFWRVFF